MSLVPHPNDCPPAYGGCTCSCHRVPGIMHMTACCRPGLPADFAITREWAERMAKIEGNAEICVGSSALSQNQEQSDASS